MLAVKLGREGVWGEAVSLKKDEGPGTLQPLFVCPLLAVFVRLLREKECRGFDLECGL